MAIHLPPPPRPLSLFSQLVLLHSSIYSVGSWILVVIASLTFWLTLTGVFDGETGGIIATFSFGGLGLISVISTWRKGLLYIRLLRRGESTGGRIVDLKNQNAEMTKKIIGLLEKMNTGSLPVDPEEKEKKLDELLRENLRKKPNQVMMKYKFEYQTQRGETHQTEAKVRFTDSEAVEDDDEETILYLPHRPDKAQVYDAIPNAPEIRHGNYMPMPITKAVVLLPPLIVIVGNIFAAYWVYGAFWEAWF